MKTNVRVIAATHRDLYEKVQRGEFREDLYYRLNVVPLELPPLRLRSDDITLLLDHMIEEIATRYELEAPRFNNASLAILRSYRWPGNVCELRNFCERMVVLLAGREIQPGNLPREMHHVRLEQTKSLALPDSGLRLEALEQSLIRQALDKTHGNRSRAARLLGLSRDTLLYRLKIRYRLISSPVHPIKKADGTHANAEFQDSSISEIREESGVIIFYIIAK